jgi:hypothetical protein
VTIVGHDRLDGIWFETLSRLSRQGVVDYCNSMVWQVGSSGGLAKRLDKNNMFFGRFPNMWMDIR